MNDEDLMSLFLKIDSERFGGRLRKAGWTVRFSEHPWWLPAYDMMYRSRMIRVDRSRFNSESESELVDVMADALSVRVMKVGFKGTKVLMVSRRVKARYLKMAVNRPQ